MVYQGVYTVSLVKPASCVQAAGRTQSAQMPRPAATVELYTTSNHRRLFCCPDLTEDMSRPQAASTAIDPDPLKQYRRGKVM
jgi:hypothetical protein